MEIIRLSAVSYRDSKLAFFAALVVIVFTSHVFAAQNYINGSIVPLDFNWDPNDPPLWTIRPEDRDEFFRNKTAYLQKRDGTPCDNRGHPAKLYTEYHAEQCPPYHRLLPGTGHCEGYNRIDMDGHLEDGHCASFCQIRTYFEWSEERPFPHSECHYPIKCGMTESESTSWSYRRGGTGKVQFQKALKIGITGSYSWGESKAMGHSWSINLKENQCGYFTFIPVRKITCGTMSEGKLTYRRPHYFCSEEGADHIGNYCADQMWNINDNGKLVPDGVIVFVWTNCLTREPLPMDKQDPAYRAPGVALDVKTLDSVQQGWVWNTCYLWDMGKDGKKRLFMRGSGFRDDKIGSKGEKLFKAVKECTDNKMEDASFDWYYNGYPDDSPEVQGATWIFKADVPENSDPDCFGRHLMLMGAVTQDKCQ